MHDQNHKRVRRLAAMITAAVVLALLALQPNVASERQDTYLQRTALCFNLLFSDLIAHAAQCGGTPIDAGLESLVEPGPNAPASPGPAATPDDPCPPGGGGGGGAGNAGNAGGGGGTIGRGDDGEGRDSDGCPGSAHLLAPFIADLFTQFAMVSEPAAINETTFGTDAG